MVIVVKHAFDNNLRKLIDIEFRIKPVVPVSPFPPIKINGTRYNRLILQIYCPEVLLDNSLPVTPVRRGVHYFHM